ncbi:DUF6880 family protein [Hahella sp. CCB-MM4]|uniref:DUF6880 family protein n=1 Tax=Hahella sp. (strain CCB-MM4) TaxID=1926491 RepID=UPI0011404B76|nr:DUF6880 family protein [Hahella sp. CCB-MM4]
MATDSKDLASRLAKLNKADMVDLLLELHGRHPDIDNYIDRYLLKNAPQELAESLRQSIARHGRSRRFIEYSASFSYASQLQQLLSDIQSSLLPDHPMLACDVIVDFIDTHEKILLRSDDSAGVVADVYREATLLLITSIKTARKTHDFEEGYWLGRFDIWRKRDPYHFYLDMLKDIAGALSQEELGRLAWRYRQHLKTAPTDCYAEDQKRLEALVGLRAVAKALKNPMLYAEALTLYSSEPSQPDLIDVARNYLDFLQADEAIGVLEKLHPATKEILELLLSAYRLKDDELAERNLLNRLFALEPSTENFQALLASTPKSEHQQVLNTAIAKAEQADNGTLAANLLLELNQSSKALNLLLRQGDQLQQYYYGDLLALAESFKESKVPLGAILCYRALLEDILNRAYSKAYLYAADYVQSLLELDRICQDYAHLPNHSEYLRELRLKHGTKKGFWTRVDGSVLLKGL